MATIKYWNGSAWELAIVGKQGPAGPTGPTGPAGQASLQRFRYVATGGQTSVSGTDANGNTLAYTPGLEEVFINGAAQVRGQDYTATNGTSITGISALIAGDVVEIYAWGVFNVANTIPNTLIDAKGDILAGTGADSVGRLAVGGNGTVLTANSATATGLEWAAPAGGGKILQVVNDYSTVQFSTTSGSYVDTDISASITPSSTNSRILVMVSIPRAYIERSGSATNAGADYEITRSGTQIQRGDFMWFSFASASNPNMSSTVNLIYLDSPATTSAREYKFRISAAFTGTTVGYYQGGMTLLEVGA